MVALLSVAPFNNSHGRDTPKASRKQTLCSLSCQMQRVDSSVDSRTVVLHSPPAAGCNCQKNKCGFDWRTSSKVSEPLVSHLHSLFHALNEHKNTK